LQFKHAAKVRADTPQPLDLTSQQRQEQLKQLAHIFLSIFCELSSGERAKMMWENAEEEAA
jgi:hypothetical protein